MSPEQEAQILRDQVLAAQASGDIGTLLSLMSKTAAQKPSDYIKKSLGSIRWIYYSYVDYFHLKPVDLIDLVDGLLYIDAHSYLEKRQYEAQMTRLKKQNG